MPSKRQRNRENVGSLLCRRPWLTRRIVFTALLDLRKNFEADKARIEKLKESRRFKPY